MAVRVGRLEDLAAAPSGSTEHAVGRKAGPSEPTCLTKSQISRCAIILVCVCVCVCERVCVCVCVCECVCGHCCLVAVQVRVHILEARRLVGGGLNPVVKVVCGQEVKETSTQKGTNSPTFDDVSLPPPPSSPHHPPLSQTLYFNLRERPEEMFDEVCEIKLLNAKKLLRDSLIGSFKVGTSVAMATVTPRRCSSV